MKVFSVWILMMWVCIVHAQDNVSAKLIREQSMMMEDKIVELSSAITKMRTHRLYLNQTWQHSAVVNEEDEVVYFSGRFNVLDNAIELKNSRGIRSLRAHRVKSAMIGGRYFVTVTDDQLKDQANTSFFEILSIGEINLYKKHYLKTRMSGSNSLTTSVNGDKEYYIASDLYVHSPSMLCQRLKGKKRVLNIFGENRKEIEDFVKEENLKYKSEADLIRIFDYYNSL